MSEFKGTRGEVDYDKENQIVKKENGDWLSRLYYTNTVNEKECEHNANLIIDAFKVRQQINCELSDLLEQNKEMLAMLEEVRKFYRSRELEQLIKKIKDNGK
jgi:hypothetical protein